MPRYLGCGVFFQLKPQAGGAWTEQVLHVFEGFDGFDPTGTLLQGTDGNFYGTTAGNLYQLQGACGGTGCGTIFMITSKGTLTTLYSFNGPDGAYPAGGLMQATNGTFYGQRPAALTALARFSAYLRGLAHSWKRYPPPAVLEQRSSSLETV